MTTRNIFTSLIKKGLEALFLSAGAMRVRIEFVLNHHDRWAKV